MTMMKDLLVVDGGVLVVVGRWWRWKRWVFGPEQPTVLIYTPFASAAWIVLVLARNGGKGSSGCHGGRC